MLSAMIPLIIFAALLNTAAQLLLKIGMEKIGEFNFSASVFFPITLKIISSPFIATGLFIYVFSVTVWLLVLSRVPVNIAYPLTSLGYIFNALGAYILLGEHLAPVQIIGILVIILGVYLLAQA